MYKVTIYYTNGSVKKLVSAERILTRNVAYARTIINRRIDNVVKQASK